MGLQKTVQFDIGFGVPGELAFNGPRRAQTGVIQSADPSNNVVGNYFTRAADGTFTAGGTGADGGILANPKVYAALGTQAGGTLAPTMAVPNGTVGEILMEGEVNALIDGTAFEGDDVHYATATGALTAVSPGTEPASGFAPVPGARVSRVKQTADDGGLVVIWLGKGSTTYNLISE
jgi:hypothetical protein